ncbi:MAG TPA: SPOR domain-containing protein, partial [Burkholderiaceae bacterium]
QSGRTVYRVRLGPFEHTDEADAAKTRLADSGVDAALVRVQK